MRFGRLLALSLLASSCTERVSGFRREGALEPTEPETLPGMLPEDSGPLSPKVSATPTFEPPAYKEADAIAASADAEGRVPVLVELVPGSDRGGIRNFAEERGGKVVYEYRLLPNLIALRRFPAQAIGALRARRDVRRVAPDGEKHASLAQSVPLMRADPSSLAGKANGAGVTVCVIDTGLNKTHPAFFGALVSEKDFVNSDNDATDDHGHGTHVAGIVLSRDATNRGVAPGASLAVAKVLDASGFGSDSDIIAAIDWCTVTAGARVINLSLGGSEHWPGSCDFDTTAAAVNASVDAGVVNVIATGNEASTAASPGCARRAISVGATYDSSASSRAWGVCTDSPATIDQIVCFSNGGPKTTVAAPGSIITSASHTSTGFVQKSGTSMATPHVAGLVARLLSQDPALSPNDVLGKLARTSVDRGATGFDDRYGHGRVDGVNAMNDAAKLRCSIDADCSSADPCVLDECRGGFCASAPRCDDHDACTADNCTDGVCSHSAVSIDDGNACTADGCDVCLGPTHVASSTCNVDCSTAVTLPVGSQVSGTTVGAGATYNTSCAGSTAPGPDVVYRVHLSPSQPVTISLVPTGFDGVVYVLMSDGAACAPSRCLGGMDLFGGGGTETMVRLRAPVEGDYFVVVDGYTASAQGAFTLSVLATCDPEDDGRPCDDGRACTVDDTCSAGACAGVPFTCSTHAECDDGAFCNGAETCVSGGCVAGSAPSTDDGIACTIDGCDEGSDTITNVPSDGLCSDGAACNGAETCTGPGCAPGVAVSCAHLDGACAVGACFDPAGTCTASPLPPTEPCDDGNPCTADDHCDGAGACTGTGSCGRRADQLQGTSTNDWTQLFFAGSITSPVVVCSAETDAARPPVVVRVRNVTSTSFEAAVVSVDAARAFVPGVPFDCLGVAEGVYTTAADGMKLEAVRFVSTKTDRKGSMSGEPRAYAQSYASPVVIGQVMSADDPNWSVFWTRGSVTSEPPSPTVLRVGKTVAEDTLKTRANELIGYLVLEAGAQTIDGVSAFAGLGAESIRGFTNTSPSPPYAYAISGVTAPDVAVVSSAGLNGGDGGWPLLYGPGALSESTLGLVFDEDEIGDLDRSHSNEQVAFVVLSGVTSCPGGCDDGNACTVDACQAGACTHAPLSCDDGQHCNGTESCSPQLGCQAGTPPSCTGLDGACVAGSCDEGTDTCVPTPRPEGTPCDDGDACTSNDVCDAAGQCAGANVCSAFPAETQTFVSGAGFTPVALGRTYVSPVVVCSAESGPGKPPVVARVRNAAGSSFEGSVARADLTRANLSGVSVRCVIVEAGVYTLAEHGVRLEAVRLSVQVTDRKGSWVGTRVSYSQTYTSPVVLGQVMTANDPDWSVFWARGSLVSDAPTASKLFIGKHVAEDTITARTAEAVGYIVIEAGTGSLGARRFAAGVGSVSVQGFENAPPYAYSLSALPFTPTTAVVSSAGLIGNDGSWPLFWGPGAVAADHLDLVVDEDAILDAERVHPAERLAYLVIE
ncbi:MAG: S8 family serine peptidase [Deltaproteobacteria bacterium]|nr:S8 family serine peptidase [Deltaproteobacteria bacterium]